jgi:hypothetical protein
MGHETALSGKAALITGVGMSLTPIISRTGEK